MGCAACTPLKGRGKWFAALAALLAIIALGWSWYSLGRPDSIQPDEKFELQFGQGRGWHGLDVLQITSEGKAV